MTGHTTTRFKKPRLGVAYYPEQWPRDRWRLDASRMAELGLTLVRMGEFAWSQMEPHPGQFDLEWLDEAVEIFATAGLKVILGTPTAAPPAWLIAQHPEILPLTEDGRRLRFGNRRHYCPNQPALREATARIVSTLANRYGRDTRVVCWQVDNEFGGRCYCETCRVAFTGWLRSRYGSLAALNEAWGTSFWSQTYSEWDQIQLPDRAPYAPNPGLALDYRRFVSDSYVGFQAYQISLIRQHAPTQSITHNMMGFRFGEIDYFSLAKDLDIAAWDNYPSLHLDRRWSSSGLEASVMRGLGRPVWVMEQQAGPVGWETVRTPESGQIRLWAYQSIAHGAEAVLFFRWRTARFGTEQHWHGLLNGDGSLGPWYAEVEQMSRELVQLGEDLEGARAVSEVAVLHDYDSRFALEIQPTNQSLDYRNSIQTHFGALRKLGLGVDVIAPSAALDNYRLVVAPNLYVIDRQVAEHLARYVADGGVLVLAPRSAIKDRSNAIPERPLPAYLDGLTGVRVVNYHSLHAHETAAIEGTDMPVVGGFLGWYEQLKVRDADVVARYVSGSFAGSAAITARQHGSGRVLYLAGTGDQETVDQVLRSVVHELGLRSRELPPDVELVPLVSRSGAPMSLILNHSDVAQEVHLPGGPWRNLMGKVSRVGSLDLAPYGVEVMLSESVLLPEEASR